MLQGDRDIVASTHVKQRITHFAKPTETAYVRPRIRLEYGAKVPQSIRQKYLDKLVDEYLCIYDDQQEAFDKVCFIDLTYLEYCCCTFSFLFRCPFFFLPVT